MSSTIPAHDLSTEIADAIKKIKLEPEIKNSGSIVELGDSVAQVSGLSEAMYNELLEFPHTISGIALNLGEDRVGCVLLGDERKLQEGDEVFSTGKIT